VLTTIYNIKSFLTHKAHNALLMCISLDRQWPVYIPAFAGTHCTYPQRDGQAELTEWLVTY